MPIAPPSNPLIDLMYTNNIPEGDSISREDLAEIQREQETRLIGTFMVQSIFLGLAIMLYETWEWSQLGQPYQAALFYGIFGFSLQASLYFTYRTMFEDSSKQRRELKRMKNKQRSEMGKMKFKMQKQQMDMILKNQMAQYQNSMNVAMSDGVIDNNEAAMLQQQLQALQQTAQQIQPQQQEIDIEALAKQLGLDRFRIGPLPVGPKLTVSQPPVKNIQVPTATEPERLDLNPSKDE